MRAHPKTTYVKASPEVWGRIRTAYLTGLSGPAAAARFGVSVSALRKRARREGWTKAAQAAQTLLTPAGSEGAGLQAGAPDEAELLAAARASLRPVDFEPDTLARRALASAVVALNQGEGLKAQRLARAADEIATLAERLSYLRPGRDADEDEGSETRIHMLQGFIAASAMRLARDLHAGRPLSDHWAAVLARVEADEAPC